MHTLLVSPETIFFDDDCVAEGFDLIPYCECACPAALTAWDGNLFYVVSTEIVENGLPPEYIASKIPLPEDTVSCGHTVGTPVDLPRFLSTPPIFELLPSGPKDPQEPREHPVVHATHALLWDPDGRILPAASTRGPIHEHSSLDTYSLVALGRPVPFAAPWNPEYYPCPPDILGMLLNKE